MLWGLQVVIIKELLDNAAVTDRREVENCKLLQLIFLID